MSRNDPDFSKVSLELNRHIVNLLDSLSALSALADLPLAGLTLSGLLKKALGALMENQDLERCSIFLIDEENREELVNAAGLDWEDLLHGVSDDQHDSGEKPKARRPPTRFRLGEGIIGQAALSGELTKCSSIAADPRFRVLKNGSDPSVPDGSLLCVPIRSEEQILGVLNVFYPMPDFFTIWHQRLLLLFCTMLGRLLINRQLFDEMETLVAKRTAELSEINLSLMDEVARRSRAENELADQHRFLQTVIDGCAEPIMAVGFDYRILLANQAARSMAEANREQLFCYQLSHRREQPCDGADHPCPLKMVKESGQAVKVVHEHLDEKGLPRAMEILASPFFGPDGLPAGIIESCRDVTERVLTESRLQEEKVELHTKAYHDELTSLPNRALLGLRLHHILSDIRQKSALLFIDLDGFKAINDRHGHLFADRILQVVAKRLRQAVRQRDLVARFAGDEFVVVLEDLDHGAADAARVAEKLLAALVSPITLDHIELRAGASIGIAIFPDDASNPDELLERADMAMFRAKKEGKNTWRLYGQGPADPANQP